LAEHPGRNDTDRLRSRFLDYLRQTVESLADEVRPIPVGWQARSRSLPLVHTLNQLHVTGPSTAPLILAAAEEHQGDQPYRHLVVDDEGTASLLVAELEGSTWKVDREVLMAVLADPDREVGADGVGELSEDEMVAIMRRWHVEEGFDTAPGVLDQLDEYNRREGALWNESRFGVRGESGAAVAITKLRCPAEDAAWVEDVYTVPEERGRGHARRLVSHATRQAGRRLTFILADDNDWPKHLYAQIGFRPIGLRWSFHLENPVGGSDGRT
jgi:GNAT superfamily N-acetyltransferase